MVILNCSTARLYSMLDTCYTTTFDAFPSNIPTFSPATCRWGNISPAKCRWRKVDGVSSMAKRSPATIPKEKWAPRIFWSRNWCHSGSIFPQRHVAGEKSD
ncbi:hypothetical protein Tco_1007450 [Tanacetum coccineum]